MTRPRSIGPFITTEVLSPHARAIKGRAVVPGKTELRSVDLYNARPVLNQRAEIITAENSSFQFLRFARIALQQNAPAVTTTIADDEEAIFYVNRGSAMLRAQDIEYTLGMGDTLYVGLGERVTISCYDGLCDISEFRAVDCHSCYPVQLVRHRDIEGTPLAAEVGKKRPMSQRTVYKIIDQNVQACRLLFGDTFIANRGGIGSYPPHFHGPDGPLGLGKDAKEEIYHFRCVSDIPGDTPYVLQNCARPGESVNTYVHIFDEQALNVTPNYHDTIAPAAVDFMFTWCLGAFTENERDWARIVTRPGYENEW